MVAIKLTNPLPRHLLDINSLGKSGIDAILSPTPSKMREESRTAALLFFEHSTRTRLSFELAAHQVGITPLSPSISDLSIQKGETVMDTISTLAAMGIDQMVLRVGENGLPAQAAAAVGDQCRIINAGDGTNQHPTQALTDLYTLKKYASVDWEDMQIGIVGNVSHSRVAHSLIDGLTLMGVKTIRLIAPTQWQPTDCSQAMQCTDNLQDGLAGLHAVAVLRAQWERMPGSSREEVAACSQKYCLKASHLKAMHPKAIVLHPGPVLQDQELAAELLHHNAVMINQQVRYGVLIRKKLLTLFS